MVVYLIIYLFLKAAISLYEQLNTKMANSIFLNPVLMKWSGVQTYQLFDYHMTSYTAS